MNVKFKILILLIFSQFILANNTYAEGCEIKISVQNEKEEYAINDTIVVLVKVTLNQEFCDEAGEATKIFSKGLKIIERSSWTKISDSTLEQKLVLTVLNKSNEKTFTVYRKTAHYNCFKQMEFKIRNN
jgi:hypothetical protein